MKTLCAFDNVACLVEQFPKSLGQVGLAFAVMGGAIFIAYIIASLAKGN